MFNNTTPIVLNLIIINVLVYFSGSMLGFGANEFLSLHYIESGAFNPIQFFTYMFVHGSGMHIFSNMLGLFFFGPVLERHWGSKKFLIYYVVCGVGAGILYSGYVYYDVYTLKQAVNLYISNPTAEMFSNFLDKHSHENYLLNYTFINDFAADPNNTTYIDKSIEFAKTIYTAKTKTTMVGASGALYAVLLGVGIIFPFMEVFLLFPPLPLKMMYLVIFYGLTSVYGMVQNQSGDNVAHFAHLSGMIVGFIMLKIWGEKRANYY
jgi:membrane associated rhomboid family serine protease